MCFRDVFSWSAKDALVQTLIKGAVNCDDHNDLQISVNQKGSECGICFLEIP